MNFFACSYIANACVTLARTHFERSRKLFSFRIPSNNSLGSSSIGSAARISSSSSIERPGSSTQLGGGGGGGHHHPSPSSGGYVNPSPLHHHHHHHHHPSSSNCASPSQLPIYSVHYLMPHGGRVLADGSLARK